MKTPPSNIIISRTDSIGDVMLTLPVAGVLKQHFPGIKIAFLGRSYTRPVIEACSHVDQFIDVEDFLASHVKIAGETPRAILHVFPVAAVAKRAKQLHIPLRIGTTNRLFHWTTCNKLVRLSRKNSPLHEAQLNIKLLAAFGISAEYTQDAISKLYGFTNIRPLPSRFEALIVPGKYNLILHPKSQGSAREWGLVNFIELIRLLDKSRFNILISGTAKERAALTELFDAVGNEVTDITGLMNLDEFIAFIARSNGLVANSTGPLHIAAALGKDAIGIYPPIRPMHPGRWAPIGPRALHLSLEKDCSDCRHNSAACSCITQVAPHLIAAELHARI